MLALRARDVNETFEELVDESVLDDPSDELPVEVVSASELSLEVSSKPESSSFSS